MPKGAKKNDDAYLDSELAKLRNIGTGDSLTSEDTLIFTIAALYTVGLPLYLYISILDLALDDTQTAVVTALFGLGAMLTLFKQYEVTRKEKIDMESKALKESKAVKDARKHSVTQDATVSLAIAKRSMAWSLFYNNSVYLLCMAFFGMYFLRGHSVSVNYAVATLLSIFIRWIITAFQ